MNPMTSTPIKPIACSQTRKAFSGYLDGVVGGREMLAIAAHLEDCNNCADEFAAWRGVQQALGQMGKLQAPPDLGLKLRLAISHESARRQGRWRDEFSARWENLVRPMVLQVSAGLAGTLILLGSLAMMIGVVAAPEAVLANDEPLGALTAPHFLYSSAPSGPLPAADDTPIVIQALVNAEGRVYDYTIVSGPRDPATLSQVRDELMLQVYAPARVFGEAVRGHVLITFAGVSVKGQPTGFIATKAVITFAGVSVKGQPTGIIATNAVITFAGVSVKGQPTGFIATRAVITFAGVSVKG